MSAEAAAEKLREKLRKLFALLGSSNAGEREAARGKIDELLAKNKKNWNDLTELLRAGNTQGWHDDEPDGATAPTSARPVRPAPLDLIRHILERHLHLTDHQLVALTLWIAHTFLFSRFAVTPRLIFESPVRGCGKTTGLNLIKALGFKTVKTDHITAAVTFRLIDRDRPTLLVDEADNQDLPTNAVLRAVINSGHHCDGRIMRYLGGEIVEFTTFAPLAFATISKLPLPILHRSVVIHMQRSAVELTRFDPKTILDQAQDCLIVYREVLAWAQQCELNLNPPMPEGLSDGRSSRQRGDRRRAQRVARRSLVRVARPAQRSNAAPPVGRRDGARAGELPHPAADDLAAAAGHQGSVREGLFQEPVRGGVGCLLRRHTVTA